MIRLAWSHLMTRAPRAALALAWLCLVATFGAFWLWQKLRQRPRGRSIPRY